MARKLREKSDTGIYHVMIRGINKQQIFFDKDDYYCMQRALADAPTVVGPDGSVVSRDDCTIYAYAILPNHMHLLIREGERNISNIMRKIEDKYVIFYNKKYERIGPLFQGRFRSEPVNNIYYFNVLLRYIHLNPVKAMLCKDPADYEFCSWREYINASVRYNICETAPVLKRFPLDELKEWLQTDVEEHCLDMDDESNIINDDTAWEILTDISQVGSIEEFKQLSADLQLHYIREALDQGISIRQASRLSSLSYHKIRKAITGSDPMITLSDNQRKVLDYIRYETEVTTADLIESLSDLSVDQVKYALYSLQRFGYVTRQKAEKGGKPFWTSAQPWGQTP